jgi:hypothetical protein
MPPTPCTCSPPTCCSRCGAALVEFRARIAVDAPGEEPQTGALCLDCYSLLIGWFFRRQKNPGPLAHRVRVPTVGAGRGSSAFDRLFTGKD